MDGSTSAWTESDYSKESIKLCVNKSKMSLVNNFLIVKVSSNNILTQ